MATVAIWLDGEHAKIFEFTSSGINHFQMKKHEPDHHTHNSKDHSKHSDHFFKDILSKVKDAKGLILFGPGEARTHFKTFVIEHNQHLAKKILANEAMDHPTDNQIIEHARKLIPVAHQQ